jgi:hypothetical protein
LGRASENAADFVARVSFFATRKAAVENATRLEILVPANFIAQNNRLGTRGETTTMAHVVSRCSRRVSLSLYPPLRHPGKHPLTITALESPAFAQIIRLPLSIAVIVISMIPPHNVRYLMGDEMNQILSFCNLRLKVNTI